MLTTDPEYDCLGAKTDKKYNNYGRNYIWFAALGAADLVEARTESSGQIIKVPLSHNIQGCSQETIEHTQHIESISELCISREKLIYQALPKNPNILDCLAITDRGILLPYHELGNVRDYLQHQQVTTYLRDRWIKNAIDAITVLHIHTHSVIHADISPRNFLVADDLSIKLCDFAGSAISDLEPFVQEEDRYRISPWSPRTFKTDIFALGCLVYELSTGLRPYHDIDDLEEVGRRYAVQTFPSLDGLRYQDIIYKCWTCQYETVEILRGDYDRCIGHGNGLDEWPGWRVKSSLLETPFISLVLGIVSAGSIFFWSYQRRSRQ
ncbi:uncharacterized protein N7459_004918 [Penicillium hispanicum]|uniref:uncharacterized protein n=1 Tax=Penicillium hispanicum TaxID=1080232 RepID=UPI00254154EA|nr:uncharacterized protein N7459_004918 [Penicillium hispanicum]KAJ5585118.1 hypothetical protein N7459_004918 [Penicillium hispanicum]